MADRRNLAVFRARYGLTRNAMADKIGVARTTYSEIENAKRDCSMRFLEKLQAAFNIPDSDMWALTKIHNDNESEG